MSNNEQQSNKNQTDETKAGISKEESSDDSSAQQSDQTNTSAEQGDIETKIKINHTGITQQIGLLSESNETTKKYSDIVSQYQQMRNRNLAQSGISQAFGSLLPKTNEEEQKAKEQDDDDGWHNFKQNDEKK